MPAVYLVGYLTDAGQARNLELDQQRAVAGGFSAGTNANGPPYPLHGKFLRVRGVYGRSGAKKMFLPCATQGNMESLYAAGSFSAGLTYVITGKRGERDSTTQPLP